uniref:Ycf1 n=1 Tax=Romanomermis culicivorax TaxID=13658 RepID=A0A915HT25_ROMCU
MDKQKWKYEMEVYNRENISLDPSKFSKNPAKRFGQQNNMDKTIIHNAPKEYFEL